MNKCNKCLKEFSLSNLELELKDKLKLEDLAICPDCIMQNILAFWPSIGKWYKRKCDFSGETIVTNYPTNARFPVYKTNHFESDKWSAEYVDIDLDKTFFSQLKGLQEKIPRPHMLGINNENCDYCDDMWNSKDCYLAISALECENVYYSYRNIRCKNSSDLVFCYDSENCYSLTNSINCYRVFYGFNVENSSDSMFLYDCRNVKNCFMCWNLRGKEFCILNKQYSKEEYDNKLKEINFGSRKEIQKLQKLFLSEIKEKALHRAIMNINCENVSGNINQDSKNCVNINLFQESQSCANAIRGYKSEDSLNIIGLFDSKLCYGICQSSYLYNVKFSSYSASCSDSEYLDNCTNCKNCLGCVGLKNKEFCILNKQYSKDEYESLKQKIIEKMKQVGEYGQFFPYNMAYSGYNTTLARFYYPENKNDILNKGGYWEDEEILENMNEGYILPDDIKDLPDDIISKKIICRKSSKQFNYIPQVIEFHKKNNIPLSDISHIERMSEMYYPLTFIKPYEGKCFLTGENIIHYYGEKLGYKKIASNEAYDKEMNG